MPKLAVVLVVIALLAGCGTLGEGTLIDFGPEPGTPGDPAHWHFQPQLHGPNAPPRDGSAQATPAASPAEAAATAPVAPAAEAAAPAMPVLPPPPPPPAVAPAPTSEQMFNDAIRRAVEGGDIDRALRLLEEAERLGSQSARPTFIEALQSR
jgi:hypothetical protein